MLTLLHISDLHFGPPFRQDVADSLLKIAPGWGPTSSWPAATSPSAKPEQFAAARLFLDQLPKLPTIVVPGNHDIPLYRVGERLLTPYALYRQYICDQLDTVLRRDDAVIVALNTTNPLRDHQRPHRTGTARLLQRRFSRRAGRGGQDRRCASPFAPAPDYDHEGDKMAGAKRRSTGSPNSGST